RRRHEPEDRDEERDGRERLLAAREEPDRLVPLARRLRHDLEAGVEGVVLVQEVHGRRTAVEEAREDLAEVPVDRGEGLLEALGGRGIDRADRLLDLRERLLEIQLLRRELLQALVLDLVFLERRVVDGPEPLERRGEPRDLRGERLLVRRPALLERGQLEG